MHYAITPDGIVYSYKSLSHAADAAFSFQGHTAKDDDVSQIPTGVLVKMYNLIRPEKPITKFADRETAEKRMKGVTEALAKPGPVIQKAEVPAAANVAAEAATTSSEDTTTMATTTNTKRKARSAKKTISAKKTSAKKTPNTEGLRGRTSAFSGKIIHKLVKENPRREGTAGFNSFGLIRDGMTYEQYIEKGGRRQDLAWDIDHKYVELKRA